MRFLLTASLILGVSASALGAPTCLSSPGEHLPVNNQQVLDWKKTTSDTVRARAHIQGQVVHQTISKDRSQWISVKIGPTKDDVVEVLYNPSHPPQPKVKKGDNFEACGDLFSQPGGKAAAYWVHIANDNNQHLPGFVVVRGKVYGGLKVAAAK